MSSFSWDLKILDNKAICWSRIKLLKLLLATYSRRRRNSRYHKTFTCLDLQYGILFVLFLGRKPI